MRKVLSRVWLELEGGFKAAERVGMYALPRHVPSKGAMCYLQAYKRASQRNATTTSAPAGILRDGKRVSIRRQFSRWRRKVDRRIFCKPFGRQCYGRQPTFFNVRWTALREFYAQAVLQAVLVDTATTCDSIWQCFATHQNRDGVVSYHGRSVDW